MSKPEKPTQSRVRASETAIKAALKALGSAGLTVHKVCVNGGKVEIHTLPVEETKPRKPNGPKQWT